MILFSEEELGEIIDITEEMCNQEGWVKEVLPLAQKRMDIINKARLREQSIRQDEREKVLDKLTERIKRFEEHQVFCITRNQIWTCDKIRRFIAELRTPTPEAHP